MLEYSRVVGLKTEAENYGALWLNFKTNRPKNRNMFFIILTHNFLFDYMILLQIFLMYCLNLRLAINALANWKIRDEIIETCPYLLDGFLLSLTVVKHYSASTWVVENRTKSRHLKKFWTNLFHFVNITIIEFHQSF